MYGFCGVYGCMVSIPSYGLVRYGMVWCVSKHKHKDNLGTLGSVLECFEAYGKRLNAFRVFLVRRGAFGRPGRLGRLGKHNPILYVWYGMYIMYSKHSGIKQELRRI